MILKIISSTNSSFVGYEFENTYPLVLPNSGTFTPDSVVTLSSGVYRLINSNLIIDVKEI